MRATVAAKATFAINIAMSVAVNIHGRASMLLAPMLSRMGLVM